VRIHLDVFVRWDTYGMHIVDDLVRHLQKRGFGLENRALVHNHVRGELRHDFAKRNRGAIVPAHEHRLGRFEAVKGEDAEREFSVGKFGG
jgi:hypothetical protein